MKYTQQEQIEATQRIRSRNTEEGQRTLATRIRELDFPRESDDYEDALRVQTVSWATIYNRIRRFDQKGPANLTEGDTVRVFRDGSHLSFTPGFDDVWVGNDMTVGAVRTVTFVGTNEGVHLSDGFSYPRQTLVKLPAMAATG